MTSIGVMSSIEPYVPMLFNDRTIIPLNVKSAIDVGCGKGTIGALLRNHRNLERSVGLDAHTPYLVHNAQFKHYDEDVMFDLGRGERLPFDDREFDLVLCLEVIEHLEKNAALGVLDELRRIGRRVVVSTPTYYVPRGALEGNHHQRHRCRVSYRELRHRGYTVRGHGPVRVPLVNKTLPIMSERIGAAIPWVMSTFIAVANDNGGG